MSSFEAYCLTKIVNRFSNFNTVQNPNLIQRLKKINHFAVNSYCPKGFRLSRETTPAGTKFERITKSKSTRNGKLILYFHGGAYIAGLLSYYKNFSPDFYKESGGAEIIFLDYKLAPEYQYPVQLNEALDLWQDITQRQGYHPENIILGGDSAGANLALAMMLQLRDSHKKLPAGAFCISAWADMTGNSESFVFNYGKDAEFGEIGKKMTRQTREILHNSEIYSWVGNADRTNPYISPVFADYHGFPPMVFTAGSHEMLLCDTLTIVQKLKQSGIPVACDIQPEMFHIYTVCRHLTPESSHSYWLILRFIKRMLQNKMKTPVV